MTLPVEFILPTDPWVTAQGPGECTPQTPAPKSYKSSRLWLFSPFLVPRIGTLHGGNESETRELLCDVGLEDTGSIKTWWADVTTQLECCSFRSHLRGRNYQLSTYKHLALDILSASCLKKIHDPFISFFSNLEVDQTHWFPWKNRKKVFGQCCPMSFY